MADTAVQIPPLIREKRWQAPAVSATTVQRTFTDMWRDIADERRELMGRPRTGTDSEAMRTRTLNLVAIADRPEDVTRIKETVLGLTEFFPSRTVILVREHSRLTTDGLDVTIAAEEHSSSRFKSTVRFETVVVSSGSGPEAMLASVATPLFVPELPDFIWYPSGSVADSTLLVELIPGTDRVIVDSATFPEPSRALRYLADLSLPAGRSLALSDMVWTRLTTWRQMIAQFFDIAANQPCLEAIEDVQILYSARTPAGESGLTAGLLTAAWLCTRLGWRAPGEELVRAKDGWKLTLRAGAKGRSREVILTLRSSDNPDASPSLQSVHLTAGGDHAGIFAVERVSEEGVQTTSETPTPVQRIVYARNPSHAALLSQELREFAADPIYNEALHFAANLWPEGAEG